jgi:hypothetical protein
MDFTSFRAEKLREFRLADEARTINDRGKLDQVKSIIRTAETAISETDTEKAVRGVILNTSEKIQELCKDLKEKDGHDEFRFKRILANLTSDAMEWQRSKDQGERKG